MLSSRASARPWLVMLLVAALVGFGASAATNAAEHGDDHHDDDHAHAADGHAADSHGGDGHGDDGHGAGGHGGDHGSEGSLNPLTLDPDLAIWSAVVFGVLMFLLGKFAWPTIAAALLEREKRIEDNIADAERMNAEAKSMLAEHEAKLATAADEVRELLDEARRDAEATKTQILAEAKDAADKERERAVREVEIASDKAMHRLAETSANMAVDWAGKVAKESISPDRQAEIVREALGQLSGSSNN